MISCSQQVREQAQYKIQNNSVEITGETKENALNEKLPEISPKNQFPDIKIVREPALIRYSENKDKNGWMMPPYKYAEINLSFPKEPQVGEKVTIIPLKVKIEPFQLAITKVTKIKPKGCEVSKTNEFIWTTEFEKITDNAILEEAKIDNYNDQMPFGVFMIYPSVESAKSLEKKSISKTLLPKNISLKRIEALIDLDNDNKPDLLSVSFCCGEPENESAENCPYLCPKYYKKTDGVWKNFDILDVQDKC